MEAKYVWFQPPGIKYNVCERGMIHPTDLEHIWYLDEPCKILISEVKIIPDENVEYNFKKRIGYIKNKSQITNH